MGNVIRPNEEKEEEETEEEQRAGREMWDTYLQASSWWSDQMLDTFPLTAGPCLWFWSDGRHVHACWDNRELRINNIPAWTAQKGQIQWIWAHFLDEVQAFHTRFFAEMANRIQEIKETYQPEFTDRAPVPAAFAAARAGSQAIYAPLPQKGADPEERFWPHPDIALDLAELEEQQRMRFQQLASSLERVSSSEAIDVDAIFNAMAKMDKFAGLSSK